MISLFEHTWAVNQSATWHRTGLFLGLYRIGVSLIRNKMPSLKTNTRNWPKIHWSQWHSIHLYCLVDCAIKTPYRDVRMTSFFVRDDMEFGYGFLKYLNWSQNLSRPMISTARWKFLALLNNQINQWAYHYATSLGLLGDVYFYTSIHNVQCHKLSSVLSQSWRSGRPTFAL